MNSKIVVRITYFTENGRKLYELLASKCHGIIFEEIGGAPLEQWTKEAFELHLPIVFIGATGIAVRTIAGFVNSKLSDSPVIVIDEKGQNVIPILSGHYGGANELALYLAGELSAYPVITTATDINNVFAIDVFARNNGLRIADSEGIKKISSKLLQGEAIRFADKVSCSFCGELPANVQLSNEEYDVIISDSKEDRFTLIPKRLVLGMGCKKGKSFEELRAFVLECYKEDYLRDNLFAIATIDLKAAEPGLIKLAQYFGVKLLIFSDSELEQVPGDFPESEFVKATVGVSNVCERAAIKGAGLTNRILEMEKVAKCGMTLAAARREEIIIKWQD